MYLLSLYFDVTAAYCMFRGAPLCHGYGITASLEFLVFRFVNARFPYLFCVTFLCELKARPVVVHICMRVIHILPSPSSSSELDI